MSPIRLVIAICLVLISSPTNAITPEKEKDLNKLMELLDVSAMPEQIADMTIVNVIAQEKKRMPNMPKNVEHAISSVIRNVYLKHTP